MRFLTVIPFAAIVVACGSETVSPIVVAHPRDPARSTTTTSTTPPDQQPFLELSCVSDVIPIFDGAPQVLRLQVGVDGLNHAQVTVAPGSQFWSHNGEFHQENPGVTFNTKARRTSTSLHVIVDGDRTLDVQKRDAEIAWRGTYTDDETRNVVCWNLGDLFGEYGGGGSRLPAHFDFETDTCVNTKGEAALNALPIELVRETGFGECADLRGVSLNGDDHAMPDLAGFDLVGARLDGATLFFANLTSTSLAGADLDGLQFGYASIDGNVDAATKLPGDCAVDDASTVHCTR